MNPSTTQPKIITKNKRIALRKKSGGDAGVSREDVSAEGSGSDLAHTPTLPTELLEAKPSPPISQREDGVVTSTNNNGDANAAMNQSTSPSSFTENPTQPSRANWFEINTSSEKEKEKDTKEKQKGGLFAKIFTSSSGKDKDKIVLKDKEKGNTSSPLLSLKPVSPRPTSHADLANANAAKEAKEAKEPVTATATPLATSPHESPRPAVMPSGPDAALSAQPSETAQETAEARAEDEAPSLPSLPSLPEPERKERDDESHASPVRDAVAPTSAAQGSPPKPSLPSHPSPALPPNLSPRHDDQAAEDDKRNKLVPRVVSESRERRSKSDAGQRPEKTNSDNKAKKGDKKEKTKSNLAGRERKPNNTNSNAGDLLTSSGGGVPSAQAKDKAVPRITIDPTTTGDEKDGKADSSQFSYKKLMKHSTKQSVRKLELLRRQRTLTEAQESDIREVFSILDENGSGTLSAAEIQTSLRLIGIEVPDEAIQNFMRAAHGKPSSQPASAGSGTDRAKVAGELNFSEFRELMMRQLIIEETEEDIRTSFEIFEDPLNPGYINTTMMMEILQCVGDFLTEDEVKELFASADPSDAGKIELKGFIRLLVS